MKTTIVIFLFCFSNLIHGINSREHPNPIPLTIIPGQGVNNIKLGTSNYADVLDFKIQFVVDSAESIACGRISSCHSFWKRYHNENSGLFIEYSSECFPENHIPKKYTRQLSKITIRNNKLASLSNGIRIGTSTYADVIKIYGPMPADWKNENYLRFDQRGISFHFDEKLKLNEIEIFKPEK